jgi:hypothetical protein
MHTQQSLALLAVTAAPALGQVVGIALNPVATNVAQLQSQVSQAIVNGVSAATPLTSLAQSLLSNASVFNATNLTSVLTATSFVGATAVLGATTVSGATTLVPITTIAHVPIVGTLLPLPTTTQPNSMITVAVVPVMITPFPAIYTVDERWQAIISECYSPNVTEYWYSHPTPRVGHAALRVRMVSECLAKSCKSIALQSNTAVSTSTLSQVFVNATGGAPINTIVSMITSTSTSTYTSMPPFATFTGCSGPDCEQFCDSLASTFADHPKGNPTKFLLLLGGFLGLVTAAALATCLLLRYRHRSNRRPAAQQGGIPSTDEKATRVRGPGRRAENASGVDLDESNPTRRTVPTDTAPATQPTTAVPNSAALQNPTSAAGPAPVAGAI